MIRFRGREFETRAEVDAYQRGFCSYPRWPQVGLNGSTRDADQDSFEAMGWYDAERDDQERMDRDII